MRMRGDPNCLLAILKKQADTLEEFEVQVWFGVKVFELFFRMPKLKNITICMHNVGHLVERECPQLYENQSITELM